MSEQNHATISAFVTGLPKAELHLHLEGSFEPELMFEISKRNRIDLPYENVEEIKAAYSFKNLQEFLDIYYAGASVLLKKQDFYDLAWAYLEKVASENVRHVEVFFDPQTHTHRGVPFDVVIEGILDALNDGKKKLGMSSYLIMSYLRHLDEGDAIKIFHEGIKYRDEIVGVGLDSSELGNPPSKFAEVFELSKEAGWKLCAHAGEEGPSEYIWEAIDLLKVDRIDHGNRCLEDEKLIAELSKREIGLTICPLSNDKLQVVKDLSEHPMRKLLAKGLKASAHSDDPAYFGGYMNANYTHLAAATEMTRNEIAMMAKHSFETSFLPVEEKAKYLDEIEGYVASNSYLEIMPPKTRQIFSL
ncbi:adenosine deaminase [Poriferisphaera sp. WC338]|uniref:adenosine deaminase n=1 Tax=Poriferisphaera sp. WC338 TaxID=3425129 RepID=UPI003D814041